MAKASTKSAATYSEVTPLLRRRLDPYNSTFVAPGESYVIDSAKAKMMSDLGEVEILNEDVTSPWAPAPAPAPVVASAPKSEAKK